MATAAAVPSSITGGCLCEGVRYSVVFPGGHDWEMNAHSCQCTQCRKQAGSLIVNFHAVPVTALQWTTIDTLGKYEHSEGRLRYFCTRCGGFLAWEDRRVGTEDGEKGTGKEAEMEFTVGSVDERWLVGEGEGEEGGGDGRGKGIARGGYGTVLADAKGKQYWSGGMIKGVTDLLPGVKV